MASGHCVLVVDGPTETEEVLKAVLEPRGLHVRRVRGDRQAPDGGEAAHPHVVVLHDEHRPDEKQRRTKPGPSGTWDGVPRVVIGSAEAPDEVNRTNDHHYLPFPFQYRDLIQAVEGLLAGAE